MAAHTKIIEFFGSPACGKTTLCEYLFTHQLKGKKVAIVNQVISEAMTSKIRLFWSFSFSSFWAGVRVQRVVKRHIQRRDLPGMYMVRHAMYYNYIKKFSDYDIVLVDHGDIQCFVSLMGGKDIQDDKWFENACSNYLDTSPTSLYCFCGVTPSVVLERMHKRAIFHGRIDKIDDKKKQLEEISQEIDRFVFFAEMLKSKDKEFIGLDMNCETSSLASIVTDRLAKL